MSSEPEIGARVIASIRDDCPDRVMWRHVDHRWVDEHGCTRTWEELKDPVVVEDAPE